MFTVSNIWTKKHFFKAKEKNVLSDLGKKRNFQIDQEKRTFPRIVDIFGDMGKNPFDFK